MSAKYCSQLDRLKQAIEAKRSELRSTEVVLHHDNAMPHVSIAKRQKYQSFNWKVLDHSPYSLDIAPSGTICSGT